MNNPGENRRIAGEGGNKTKQNKTNQKQTNYNNKTWQSVEKLREQQDRGGGTPVYGNFTRYPVITSSDHSPMLVPACSSRC